MCRTACLQSDDADERVGDIDDENAAADHVADADDRFRQLTVKDTDDGSSISHRRIRRSSDVVDESGSEAVGSTYMSDSMLHDGRRGDRIRRQKSEKNAANANGVPRSSTRTQPPGGKKPVSHGSQVDVEVRFEVARIIA